jgi:uncharacterized protein (TIGR03086 family)
MPDYQSSANADHLAAALHVTEAIVAGVRPEHAQLPTPCPEYDVSQLVAHLVGFATSFADRANGVTPPADPARTTGGDDPLGAYRTAAGRLVEAYRNGAAENAVPLGVALIETVTHGWDLATATGQTTPYPEDAVEAALAFGRGMLEPRFRGDGKAFGEEIQVSPDAAPVERLVAFMGRRPDWSA